MALNFQSSPNRVRLQGRRVRDPEKFQIDFMSCPLQVLFSISQKLIQHQIVNYTDILRWLREVLTCRNAFLLRHREYANVGSHVSVAKQVGALFARKIGRTQTEQLFFS